MNIRKYLCKEFDINNKGYVTINDVYNKITQTIADNFMIVMLIGIVIIVCIFILNMIGYLYYAIFNPIKSNTSTIIISADKIFIGFIILGTIIIIILTIIIIWKKIKNIKIIVCPLKVNN